VNSLINSLLSRIGSPRLLPMTIGMLALVLVWRSTTLVHSFIISGQPAALITAALAAGPDTPASTARPGEQQAVKSGERGNPANPGQGGEKKSGGTVSPNLENKPPVQDTVPPVTDGERAVLLELRQRRQELDAREAALASRESMLAAAEMKISARVGELQTLQTKLESLDASHQQQEDNAWQGLVKVYETMKPRDAAAIFNDLGMPVLLSVVGRMKDAKAAAVLAAMTPDKARDVTTQLALSRTKAAEGVESGTQPSTTAQPGKVPGSGT
jgi:flagellar motility protein MotE (MotC chaperone)